MQGVAVPDPLPDGRWGHQTRSRPCCPLWTRY